MAAGHSVDRARRQESFEGLMQRIADRFAWVEPRRRVRDLVLGVRSARAQHGELDREVVADRAAQGVQGQDLRGGPSGGRRRLAGAGCADEDHEAAFRQVRIQR